MNLARIKAKIEGTFGVLAPHEHRLSKPPVTSSDAKVAPHPARAQAKADGTFGVDSPYVQRDKA